jgi:predicted RNA methylase
MQHATQESAISFTIGTPCESAWGNIGYIVKVCEETSNIHSLFAMSKGQDSRIRFKVVVAYEHIISELNEYDARAAVLRARAYDALSEEEAVVHWQATLDRIAEQRRKQEQEANAREEARAKAESSLAPIKPPNATHVIVARLVQDESDIMTDYWSSTYSRTVILGFSSHKRDLFSEMRKACLSFPDVAHLATADSEVENRQKYSMGGGYFLKEGGRHRDGWKVEKQSLHYVIQSPFEIAPSLLTPTPKAKAAQSIDKPKAPISPKDQSAQSLAPVAAGVSISEHVHTKKGFRMWIVTLQDRVERATFDAMLEMARASGGWYSKPWAGTPGGFAFKIEERARAFMGDLCDQVEAQSVNQPREALAATPEQTPKAPTSPARAPSISLADKLETIAQSLQAASQERLKDRLANTPKRARQAAQARQEGRDLERAALMALALAGLHRAGEVPAVFAKVSTKAALIEAACERRDYSRSGYYDAGVPTGQPARSDELTRALWVLINTPEAKAKAAEAHEKDKLAQAVEKVKFAKIEGYFPTPAAIVSQMIEAANIKPGQDVLEPSAGSGAIADAVRDQQAKPMCFERMNSLARILEMKGHNVHQVDFMAQRAQDYLSFDAVLMNPPFERGQDMEHVAHAWQFLKPGGVLVAIMSASLTFRIDKKIAAFVQFVEDLGGSIEPLPEGSFKESGTGVNTVMLTLHKPTSH